MLCKSVDPFIQKITSLAPLYVFIPNSIMQTKKTIEITNSSDGFQIIGCFVFEIVHDVSHNFESFGKIHLMILQYMSNGAPPPQTKKLSIIENLGYLKIMSS